MTDNSVEIMKKRLAEFEAKPTRQQLRKLKKTLPKQKVIIGSYKQR